MSFIKRNLGLAHIDPINQKKITLRAITLSLFHVIYSQMYHLEHGTWCRKRIDHFETRIF